jgi:hypothetical protein
MDLDSLTLGEIKQLKSLINGSINEPAHEVFKGKRIVILQRGWVYVGDYYQKGYECRLENAFCIRRWGTLQGLGELAQKGPLSETKMEPCPMPVEFHKLTEVASLGVVEEKWKK